MEKRVSKRKTGGYANFFNFVLWRGIEICEQYNGTLLI